MELRVIKTEERFKFDKPEPVEAVLFGKRRRSQDKASRLHGKKAAAKKGA